MLLPRWWLALFWIAMGGVIGIEGAWDCALGGGCPCLGQLLVG